ncbi:MAG: branched-chain amino acid ABC transporter permease [Acidimicrobiia bacterium]|nr:MAG: branched-chain amino acid ABC transporter permease [Acidimicrobiia bacterium]
MSRLDETSPAPAAAAERARGRTRGSRRRGAAPRSPAWLLTTLVLAVAGAWFFAYYVPQNYAPSRVDLFTEALFVGLAATGLNILTGFNGQVSIGHGAFFGLGAYVTALMMDDRAFVDFAGREWGLGDGVPFLATLPVVAVVCLVVGALIGFPALRVKGLYLALVTLGLAVLFPDVTKRFVRGTGGTNLVGLRGADLAPPDWYDWFPDVIADPLDDYVGARDQWAYYVALVLAACLLFAVFLIARSRFGRALIAVRDHEAAAETVGINLARVKVSAFALSAAYAGLAGSLSVLVARQANANRVETFQLSIEFLVALVVGGTATVFGPMLGGFVVVFFRDWIDQQQRLEDLFDSSDRAKLLSPAIFGIGLIVMMFFLPDGIVGGTRRAWRRFTRRRTHSITT